MHETTRAVLCRIDNDYGTFERAFEAATGTLLTGDAFDVPGMVGPPPTVSVVIPARNAGRTIERCLEAIERSSFNSRHPALLQVVVVDDGSSDDTATKALSARGLDNVDVVTGSAAGRASAMNTGLRAAEGEVVVSCDADMLLTHYAIEELALRHSILDSVLLIGFRSDVNEEDVAADFAFERLLHQPAVLADTRLSFDWPGWPENMVTATDGLKSLGNAQALWMPSGELWPLPRMVFGCLFSASRSTLLALGGYEERFTGWGWEDTELAARAVASGLFIIPVFGASGHHVAHPPRSAHQWREGARNRRLYQEILDNPAPEPRWPRSSPSPSQYSGDLTRRSKFLPVRPDAAEHNPTYAARVLATMGRTDEAMHAFDAAILTTADPAAVLGAAVLQLALGDPQLALALLYPVVETEAAGAEAATLLGLAHAASGDFSTARETLSAAITRFPQDRLLRYVLRSAARKHTRRGRFYLSRGRFHLAKRDFEAALIQDSDDRRARAGRELAIRELALIESKQRSA